jgi:oligopeptide transport system substrate-binding protein
VTEVIQNPNYWSKDSVEIRKIRFIPFQAASAEERAFRNNQLHVTDGVPLHLLNNYIAEQSPYLQMSPYLGLDYYIFNTKRKPFDDAKVRQAFNMAINREHLTRNILHGTKIPAYSFTPPNIGGYTSRAHVTENVVTARKLLANAGYPGGIGFPEVKLLFNSSEGNSLVAEAIQAMLKANLGVSIQLDNQEYKSYLANRSQRNYDMARASWVGDYVDPSTFLYVYTGDSGNNYSGWLHEAYDKHIAESCKLKDPKETF